MVAETTLHFIKTAITDDFLKAAEPGVHGTIWKFNKTNKPQPYQKKFAAISEPKLLKDVIQMHTKLQNRISITPLPLPIYVFKSYHVNTMFSE